MLKNYLISLLFDNCLRILTSFQKISLLKVKYVSKQDLYVPSPYFY